MDHQEQHHQHHKKQREHEKAAEKAHDRAEEQGLRVIHPTWFLVIGIILIGLVILVWSLV